MARKLRVEYPGAIYHVMSRGNRKEPIFHDDVDRQRFVETVGEVCVRSGWQVHAFCLLPNHFHLVLETPRPNLVAGMKWLLGTYTTRFNRRHHLVGHLFSGRYRALIVAGSGNGYLRTVCEYVHLNPARAKLLNSEQALSEYPWSSWPQYLQPARKREPWLRTDRLLGEMGIHADDASGRRELEQVTEARRSAAPDDLFRPIRRGWFFGDPEIKRQLLADMGSCLGAEHFGEERQESQAAQAECVVAEELRQRKWTEATLKDRAKGDAEKLKMAVRLRRETLMTVRWIATRLHMGSASNVNRLLYHWRKAQTVQ